MDCYVRVCMCVPERYSEQKSFRVSCVCVCASKEEKEAVKGGFALSWRGSLRLYYRSWFLVFFLYYFPRHSPAGELRGNKNLLRYEVILSFFDPYKSSDIVAKSLWAL